MILRSHDDPSHSTNYSRTYIPINLSAVKRRHLGLLLLRGKASANVPVFITLINDQPFLAFAAMLLTPIIHSFENLKFLETSHQTILILKSFKLTKWKLKISFRSRSELVI